MDTLISNNTPEKMSSMPFDKSMYKEQIHILLPFALVMIEVYTPTSWDTQLNKTEQITALATCENCTINSTINISHMQYTTASYGVLCLKCPTSSS